MFLHEIEKMRQQKQAEENDKNIVNDAAFIAGEGGYKENESGPIDHKDIKLKGSTTSVQDEEEVEDFDEADEAMTA